MQDLRDLLYVLLEDAAGVGVGDHERRRRLVNHLAQLIHGHATVFVQADFDGLEVRHRGRRRVGPVGCLGHDDGGPAFVPGILEVAPDH